MDDPGNPVHNKDLPSGKLLGLIQDRDGVFHVTDRCNNETEDACWARNKPMALRYNAFCASVKLRAEFL